MRIHFALLALCALLFSTTPLGAQGLVQISLSGAIDTSGGGRIEVEIATFDPNAPEKPVLTTMKVLLGESTSAADLAVLLTKRLEANFARVTSLGANAPQRGPVNLFVEGVVSVGLRLGNGLSGNVTLCEDRPMSVRVSPGVESKLGGVLRVVALTRQEHTGDSGRFQVDVNFADRSELTDVGMRVVRAAIAMGWPGELKGHDTWWPAPMTETQRITSCSVELRSNADWRLDVALAPR
ncbi:MAG: hypothetical protein SGI72_07505 [Planctomycetota bacterium]|nr:hypothetical protein [Planctomycetota bacterium]